MDVCIDNLAPMLACATYGNADKYSRITEYLGVGLETVGEEFTLAHAPINPTKTGSIDFWVDGEKVSWTYGVEYTVSDNTLTIAADYLTVGQELVVAYKYDTGVDEPTIEPGDITDEDYLKNVTLVGVDLEGKSKVIYLYNAMGDNNFDWKMVDKDESVLTVEFAGHWDPKDADVKPYKIVEVPAS